MPFTRRRFVHGLSFLIGSAAVLRSRSAPTEASAVSAYAEDLSPPTPTQLERFLKSRGIKPSILARQSGYSRQFLLRLRMGRMEPAPPCIAALVCACRDLTGERVRPDDLFPLDVIRHAFRSFARRTLEPDEQEEMEAAFGRRRETKRNA